VIWKTRLPGWGHSSAIVWGDAIFITSCDESSGGRLLLRIDAETGRIVWQRAVLKAPLEKRHSLNSYSSGTPTTDGQRIYVTFLEPDFTSRTERTPGNMVVAAYDFDGDLCWLVRPGRFASVHGYCSSPVLYKDTLIVNGDHDGDGYLVALDRASGDTVWRIARPNNTRSYVTPIIREIDGRTQMVLSGSMCISSYDPDDGSEHWSIRGPTEQFVASLVYNGTLLFMTAGFPDRHILAIRPDGHGDVTDTHVVWRTTRNCSYVPSPITVGEYFLVVSDTGVGTCYHANSGNVLWRERMGGDHSASLVTAEGCVYFLADDGVTRVVRPGDELDIVSLNPLGEQCRGSPAISNGRIYLRGEEHLFAIGKP
jgi:outer membrane protein assembly factor BamB